MLTAFKQQGKTGLELVLSDLQKMKRYYSLHNLCFLAGLNLFRAISLTKTHLNVQLMLSQHKQVNLLFIYSEVKLYVAIVLNRDKQCCGSMDGGSCMGKKSGSGSYF